MGIGKILSVVPEMAGKCKVWGHSKVVKKCLDAGQDLVKIAKENGGKLTIEELNRVYKKVLPRSCNIEAVNDPKVAETFLRGMNLSEDTISLLTNSMQTFVIKNYKCETLFFIPIEKFSGDKAVNVAVHEFEHVIDRNLTLQGKVQNLIFKILGLKRFERLALKDSENINLKLIKLQQNLTGTKLKVLDPSIGTIVQEANINGLLKYLDLSNKERLVAQLRKSIRKLLDPKAERKNINYLKAMRMMLSDEARAYYTGGRTAKEYLELKEGSTMSEMTSQLYNEAVGVIKREIKAQRKKGLKRALGMKVRNYEGSKTKIADIKTCELDPSELEDIIAAIKEKVKI